MKKFKQMIALATAAAIFSTASCSADSQYQEYAGGAGYIESRGAPNLAPAIALGAIALVAIIVVAVQNANNEHGHSH